MSRTNKTRTGCWRRESGGGHTYAKNSGKTYWKREGNKWARQHVRQQLKFEKVGELQRFTAFVKFDFMHDRGHAQWVWNYLSLNGPDLPMEPYELHDRWSYT